MTLTRTGSVVEPFVIDVADEVLADLRLRLDRTNPLERWDRPGWADGTDPSYLHELIRWWRDGFDWRACEKRLNRLPHYRAEVGGTRLHFVHLTADRSRRTERLPLLLCHGWPSTFYELLPVAERLAGRHDVVVPSLPGYCFSDPLHGPGASNRIPSLYVELMTEVLGYRRFGVHGGDIGAMVANRMALERPDVVAGLHVTMPAEPYLGPGTPPLSDAEQAFLRTRGDTQERGTAYAHLQRTRPLTIAHALLDSPAGLAAWIVEKWREWSDCAGDLETRFTKDDLLTTIMLFWVTGTIGTSFRIYRDWALASEGNPAAWHVVAPPGGVASAPLGKGQQIAVPTAVAIFQDNWPVEWGKRSYADLRRWTLMPAGGHFAGLEVPALLAEDLRAFFDGELAPISSSGR